ncbi:MAG: glycosyl transferase [Chloroflexi bacterium]|nr:glycosyl transferase [Chloroflexota bacterium]
MAKIIFLNVPGHGHVNPTLPIVIELLQRGHEVLYYNSADFQEKISKTGAQFRGYPHTDLSPGQIAKLANNLFDVTLLLFEESLRLLPFLLEDLRREQPDVILFDSICLWGMQAAKLLDLPHVSSITTLILEGAKGIIHLRDVPFILRTALPRLPKLFKLRRQLVRRYGKTIFPNKDIFPCVGQKNVLFTSPQFQPPTPFIDGSFTFVGPIIAPETRAEDDFPWQQLHDGTRIYVSLGTIHQNLPFLQTLFGVFADYPAQFIVSAGRQTDLAALGDVPDNFLLRPYLPQLHILEKVDLFITHGGNNSIHEGLYHGVPLLVVPQQMEQMMNGRLVAKHGAGIVLGDRPPYNSRQIKAKALQDNVNQLLHTESYRLTAQKLGDSFHETGGCSLAADVIESVAGC